MAYRRFSPPFVVTSMVSLTLCFILGIGHTDPITRDNEPLFEQSSCTPSFHPIEPISHDREPAFSKFIENSGHPNEHASIYLADINNDLTDEWILTYSAGSSGVLYVHVFRKTEGAWVEIGFPLETWHGWGRQLFGSVCGDTIINLAGGTPGGTFRQSYIWNAGGTVEPYCHPGWISQQLALVENYTEQNNFASANGQLKWLTDACSGRLSEQHLADISNEKAALAQAETLAVNSDFAWVRDYSEQSPYLLLRDPRFEMLMVAISDSRVFRDYLITNLSGPNIALKFQSDRYLIFGACRPHSCGDNGFLWLDLQTNRGIGAIINGDIALVDSRYFDSDNLPDEFLQSLKQVFDSEGIKVVSHDGVTRPFEEINSIDEKSDESKDE